MRRSVQSSQIDELQQEIFSPQDAHINDILTYLEQFDFDDPRAWPKTLADLVDVMTHHLSSRKALPFDDVTKEVQQLVAVIAHYLGGQQIYLPRDEKLRLALRDNLIWQQFDGSNHIALANRYGVTRMQIYNVLAAQKRLHTGDTQRKLFGN